MPAHRNSWCGVERRLSVRCPYAMESNGNERASKEWNNQNETQETKWFSNYSIFIMSELMRSVCYVKLIRHFDNLWWFCPNEMEFLWSFIWRIDLGDRDFRHSFSLLTILGPTQHNMTQYDSSEQLILSAHNRINAIERW